MVLCQIRKRVLRYFKTAIKNGYMPCCFGGFIEFLRPSYIVMIIENPYRTHGTIECMFAIVYLYSTCGFILYSPVVNTKTGGPYLLETLNISRKEHVWKTWGKVGWLNTVFIQCRKRSWRNSFWAAIIFSGRGRVLCGKQGFLRPFVRLDAGDMFATFLPSSS